MNAQQRRRLKRIRQRQRESAERRISSGDRQFVRLVCPPPSRVCVMSDAESQRFHDVSIGHRCTATDHRHYTRKHVDILINFGALEWVGAHCKIARWIDGKTWAKVESGGYATMQLVRGLRR